MSPVGLLFIVLALGAATSHAQVCQPDPGAVGPVWPLPWTPQATVYNLDTVCIGLPYDQTITINVPGSATVPGQGTVAVNSFNLPTTGGIANLPSGMQYSCNPANCIFAANTPGCILLHGTPDATNPVPDNSRELLGTGQLVFNGGNVFPSWSLPNDFIDGSSYYVLVRTAAVCMGPNTSSTTTTTSPGGTTLTTGTGTTSTIPGGTTTTTLPSCGAVPIRDTYPSLGCQVAALRDAVSAEPALGELADRVRGLLERVAGHLTRSQDACIQERTKRARRSLRRAVQPLRQIVRRLDSRKAQDVPQFVRDQLIRQTEAIRENVDTLIDRIACPDDAD